MQAWLGGWLRDILVAAMLAAIVEAVAPEGKIKPLVRFASGVLIVAILVQGLSLIHIFRRTLRLFWIGSRTL